MGFLKFGNKPNLEKEKKNIKNAYQISGRMLLHVLSHYFHDQLSFIRETLHSS